ncbi:MAG TPA: hypothetical protein VGQ79_04245 [Nitrospiraceae bacterium]|jgi:hypothetical protein|nr:hypothetical protein [Nitrospiraceae bacterium]
MTGQTKAPARVWLIVLAGVKGFAPFLLACVLLAAACAKPAVHRDVSTDSLPPSTTSQPGDRHVLTGEWEYVDGAAVLLTLDEQGNGHYVWKDGRFETHGLIGHTWDGMWFQKENDRDGGFMVEFLPDFSEGEGRWWYSRIGTDHAPTQKGGTFHLSKKTALMNHSDTPPAP